MTDIRMTINNTNAIISDFLPIIMAAAKAGLPLPEEISDIFTYKVILVDGESRLFIDWA